MSTGGAAVTDATTVAVESRDTATEDRYRRRFTWDQVKWSTHCTNCISTCSYRMYSGAGRVLWEEQSGVYPAGEPGVPDPNPMGCQKGAAWHRQLVAEDRLLHPMRRVGERGSGAWERITWDEALSEIADAVCDAVEEFGPQAVLVDESSQGGMLTAGAQSRFANSLGAVSLDAIASVNDIPVGHHITFGNIIGGSAAEDTFHADVVLIWHANPAYTRIPYFHYLTEARYRGATVVLIAPDFSPSAPHVDLFVPMEGGTDAALALGMCKVVIDEGLMDEEFVGTQTDMALLVRADTGMLLRAADVIEGGSEYVFFVWSEPSGLTPTPEHTLRLEHPPLLRGRFEATLADGSVVPLTTVFERLLDRLEDYSPEAVSGICGVHPSVMIDLARRVAGGRTKLYEGFDTSKHYHGDLMERSMDLLLALTGNWGRKGSGHDTYLTYPFDGSYLQSLKPAPGIEAAETVVQMMAAMFGAGEGPGGTDPSQPPAPLARPGIWDFMAMAAAGGSTTPPFFLWLDHAGYRDVFDRAEWGDSPRPFGEYVTESAEGWAAMHRPGPEVEPRVFIEGATNALRRTRGGAHMLSEHLWPKLEMVAVIEQRMSSAALQADIVLPAAQEAERVNLQYPISHSMEVVFSDKSVEPAGEARSDWWIHAALADAIAERADRRGLGDVAVGWGAQRPLRELGGAFDGDGHLRDEEAVIDELLRDTALSGVLEENTSLDTMRETGWARVAGNGCLPIGRWLGSPISTEETFCALRWHVEGAMAYATTTGRATFYVDHPWFLEAGEELPVHKDPPAIGGDHPFVLTGGHPRWSMHASNATNPLMLETTRGHPTLGMHPADADALGLAEDDWVEVGNDVGSFRVRIRRSPGTRPGQVVMYAAWDPTLFPGWADGTRVEPGMVKWLHLATGWGHLRYMPMHWQPVHFDRLHRVSVRAVGRIPGRGQPG